MTGFDGAVGIFALGQQPCAHPRHRPDRGQHQEATRRVVEQVEADHEFLGAVAQAVHPRDQRVKDRDNQQQPDQLVQQATERNLPPGGVLHAGAEKRQYAAADIGANHQPHRDRQADDPRTGQRRRQQHGGQAGVRNHREQGADQGIEQDVAGQRGEDHLHPLRLGDGGCGFDDQLQGEDDQAQADAHAPQLPGARLLAREEEDHAQENQQRRQPGQVECQHPGHQRRTDIGPEHRGQRWRERHQALADK